MTASEIRSQTQQQHDRTIAVIRDCEQRVARATGHRQLRALSGDYKPAPSGKPLTDDQKAAKDDASIRSTPAQASAVAVKASTKAQRSADPADHQAALAAHKQAAQLHTDAAASDQAAADQHTAAAAGHLAAANGHAAAINEAAAASGGSDDDNEPANKSACGHLARFMPPNPYARTTARTTDLSAARLAGAEAYREAGRAPDGYRIGLELRRLQAHPSHAIAPPPLPRDASGTPDPYNQAALRAHQRRRAGGKKGEPQ